MSSDECKQIEVNSVSSVDKEGHMAHHKFFRRGVGPKDVHVTIAYSGICHSDIHTAKGEWGPTKCYPLCVGHEMVGKVAAVGKEVTKFKVGDFAGVGCFTSSCRNCEYCAEGNEQHCEKGMRGTYNTPAPEDEVPGGVTMGGYSSAIVVNEDYVLRVPSNLFNAGGAPLLCAGITAYSPLVAHGLKPGQHLGVVGLGGLGHMAVKIGKAMGAHVTVISRTPGKKETALALGASEFVISTDKEQMAKAAKKFNIIFNSIAFAHDVAPYLGLLRTRGTMVMVGGVPAPMEGITSFSLLVRNLCVAGSLIGGIQETQEMLDFCSKHNIKSEVEIVPAEPKAVEAAWQRCIDGDVKYRFVIDTAATLPPV